MSFFLSLFFVSLLSFKLVLCEKCSEALHETFKKTLNLTDKCDSCKVHSPGIFFLGKNWSGFCVKNNLYLFEDWKCKKENELKESKPFLLVTQRFCERFEENQNFDVKCLKEFNAETCRKKFGTSPSSVSIPQCPDITKNFSSSKDILVSTPFPIPPHFRKEICEPNEFSYRDYCYFIKLYEDLKNDFGRFLNANGKESSAAEVMINSVKSCQDRHPKALGLAVETEEENRFILQVLKTVHLYTGNVIFTSGVKMNSTEDEWIGWNMKINQSFLNFKNNLLPEQELAFYCIDLCQGFWYLLSPNEIITSNTTFFIVCKRHHNPKKTQIELHERCLKIYRQSSCYNLNKHKNFCCAKDEHEELWFACPNSTAVKHYPNATECSWSCRSDGFFTYDRPICKGKLVCSATYNQIKYVAPIQRYALSSCPEQFSGHSSWYCSRNKTFLGKPDYSLCCENKISKCTDTDSFLNVWMGCPSKKVVKKVICPSGSFQNEALVEWFCQENGTFFTTTPDFSKCNKTNLMCSKKDKYDFEWIAVPGTIAEEKCPPSFIGTCFWKCLKSGKFEGPQPDCSKCKAEWMEEIANKIKNHSRHDEVMNIMETYTKTEDLRVGFGHVVNLTSDCVSLYKKQTTENEIEVFDKFLKSFSRILKNMAGDMDVWSSFLEPNKEVYIGQIVQTTQNAAFANLEIKNTNTEQYNATFTTSTTDGFDFFVAYNPPLGTNFPFQNFSQSDWNLKIKEITGTPINFAVMGLIMNCSLGSVMFPRGNKTKDLEMNAPAVTFTVAAATNGEIVIDPDVVVVISFKHTKETRFPASDVVKRKLHPGEYPSGVFNSTFCFYYRDSEWSTEGCTVTYTSKDRTNCTCNHLSTIGLLMSIHKYEPDWVLELVSIVSSAITIVSLILALSIFYFIDKTNSDRLLIGKNLCLCLLIGHIMVFSVMDKKFFNITDSMCKIYAILLHYVFMAAFAWMFVEGCHLYRMLIIVFDSDIDYRWIYLLIGYGGPLGVIGATELSGLILQEQPYGQDELCWLKTPNYVWAFIGPVILLTSINFCILILAMKMAISSQRRTEKSKFDTIKLWLKGWISLSALLGITWLFGLGYIRYNENFVYAFVVFNGLQGFFIFLFRCVLCEQYKTIILRKIKSGFLSTKSIAFKKSGNVKSDTKVYTISAIKFSSEEAAKDSGYETTVISGSDKHDRKSFSQKFLHRTKPKEHKPKENLGEIDLGINVTLTPAMSEAYLRNRMIAKNFSVRKSKAAWMGDTENFPEVFYQNVD